MPVAVVAAALFFWVVLAIDSTCGDERAAFFAVVDVPDFTAPDAAPAEPDRVERSFAPSVATAACAAGRWAGAGAFFSGVLVATVDFRAATDSMARDAGAVFAAAFLAGTLAGVFATGTAFLTGAAFFTGAFATGLVDFATGFAAAFLAGAAFLATGLGAGLAAFFATGFAAVLRAGGADFLAIFFVATSAFPSSLEAGKRAVIPCAQQLRQPRWTCGR